MKVHYYKSQDEIPMPTFFVLGKPRAAASGSSLNRQEAPTDRPSVFPEDERGSLDPSDVAERIVDWLHSIK